MADRKTVMVALENCADFVQCRDCPWDECSCMEHDVVNGVPRNLLLDALELLKAQEPVAQTVCSTHSEITDETAIDHLIRSGWMQKHDRAMSFDSLTAVVNSLMMDGNKSISVNVYPWNEDEE